MSVIIDLLRTGTLGHYFQLAALALASKGVVIGHKKTSLVLSGKQDYADLIRDIAEKIIYLKTGKSVSINQHNICSIVSSVGNIRSPRFFYNSQVDGKAMSQMNIGSLCGTQRKDMFSLALSYVEGVLKAGGPMGIRDVSVPSLFRVTIFTNPRDGTQQGTTVANADSIGLAMLGSLASFVGNVRMNDNNFEYFMVPDSSHVSMHEYSGIAEVMWGRISCNITVPDIHDAISQIVSNSQISIDIATYIAAVLRAHVAARCVQKALSYAKERTYESLLVVRIESSGNRPQMYSAGSLSISDALTRLGNRADVLSTLYDMLEVTQRLRSYDDERLAKSATSICINSLSLAVLTAVSDEVTEQLFLDCSRALASAIDRLSEKEYTRFVSLAQMVLKRLGG